MLRTRKLGYRAGPRWLVRDIELMVDPGEFVVIVGANGAGKSTLLKLLSGELIPHTGEIHLNGKPLPAYAPRELARIRACLAQERGAPFPFTVYDVAMMGRAPWKGSWFESSRDHSVTRAALTAADAMQLSERLYPSLSGGERTRVDMARVAAQEPTLLLLDEPTNHLDTRHQLALMAWRRAYTEQGGAVIAVLHDLNLAARHADRIVLLHEGRVVAMGPPDEVLTEENLRRYYDLECVIWRHPSGCPWVVPVDVVANHAGTPRYAAPLAQRNGDQ